MSDPEKAKAKDVTAKDEAPAAQVEQASDSIYFATNGAGWDSASDAQAEFRQRQLDPGKWAVTRSPRGDGYCIMTYRTILDIKQKVADKLLATAAANKAARKYHHVRIGTNADADKKDTLTLTIGLNGQFTSLMLNSKCILSDVQIEVLENARVENWVPLPNGGMDGKTFVQRGMKDRVNFSILGPATEQEWKEYQDKNKTRVEAFTADQASRDRTNDQV
jgi:hypothetical protein